MSNIHTGDTGTEVVIRVTENGVIKDLSSATAIKIILKGPDLKWSEVTGRLYSDGKDGKVAFTITATDFPVGKEGEWHIQPKITMPGWSGHADKIKERVLSNCDDVPANERD